MGNLLELPVNTSVGQSEGDALRAQAGKQAALRNEAFQRSRACYAAGDHIGAKYWSEKGKSHAAEMARLNKRAARAIHTAANAGRPDDVIDLHGLHVAEAISHAEAAIRAARARGSKRLTFIVGKGLHSADGVARLRPALTRELVTKHSLRVTPGVPNEGCLLVELVEPERAGWIDWLGGCVIC